MSKIMSIDTQDEAHFKKPADTSELTGLEAFAFGYDVQWPISLILNRKYIFFNCSEIDFVIDFLLLFFQVNLWRVTKCFYDIYFIANMLKIY